MGLTPSLSFFCRDVSTDSDQMLLSQDIDSAMEKYLSHSASGGDGGGGGGEMTKLFHLNFEVEESECGRDRELNEHIEMERRI